MALNDIAIRKYMGAESPVTVRWQTDAGDADIVAGEPLKLKAAGSPYAIRLEDGDLTIGSDTVFLGIAAGSSTHTAAADGYVDVYVPTSGTVYEVKAKTATTADTQAEIDALCGDRVVIDLTTGVYTLDAAAGDNANNAFMIVGGNPEKTTLYVVIRDSATYLN